MSAPRLSACPQLLFSGIRPTRFGVFLIVLRWVETPETLGNSWKPSRKPFHLSAGTPHRALTNISGGRSTGTNPLEPSRFQIIIMKSQGTRESNARLLPCLCVPGVFSHRTSPGASTRKSNRNRILSDSDSFILVVRFGAGCERASNVQQNERKQLMQQNACKRASPMQQHERN